MNDTSGLDYAQRLERRQRVWWKRLLPVQLPYQLNLRSQHLGVTLDVGCGLGRSLESLPPGSLGVDHNADLVSTARSLGYDAMTVDEFLASARSMDASFDSLLIAHVIEHLSEDESIDLLSMYLPYLRPGGSVFFLCPQELGYGTDPTHVRFVTEKELSELCSAVGLLPSKSYSFPFPRWAGRLFIYNEFCVRAELPAGS